MRPAGEGRCLRLFRALSELHDLKMAPGERRLGELEREHRGLEMSLRASGAYTPERMALYESLDPYRRDRDARSVVVRVRAEALGVRASVEAAERERVRVHGEYVGEVVALVEPFGARCWDAKVPARDFYACSPTFEASRALCEARGWLMRIFSASEGLLRPTQYTWPPDWEPLGPAPDDVEAWAGGVGDIVARDFPGWRVVVVASARYAGPVVEALRARGVVLGDVFDFQSEDDRVAALAELETAGTEHAASDDEDPTIAAQALLNDAACALARAEGWALGAGHDLLAEAEENQPRAKRWVRLAEVVLDVVREHNERAASRRTP